MKVSIIGGGMMGISLGYLLTQYGASVDIFEASPSIGGLAGPLNLEDGITVDRFYHTILSSDRHLRELCTELGISDQLRFRETKMGFYDQGHIYSMNNIIEFLRFPLLNWIDRFRLGLTVFYAQFVRDWHRLEGISVERWLVQLSGQRTFENIWRPMLKAKFDGGFDDTPATYIWSRLVRMKSTRSGANQKEEAGHLIGGYITLLQAMAEHIKIANGHIYLNQPVQEIIIEEESACGLHIGDEVRAYDVIVSTLQVPIFRRLIPRATQDYHHFLDQTAYLGIICPLLVLDRPLSGFWTLNITDDTIPFTGIIETTTYIDPQYVGGHHLVYLPKYTVPGSRWQYLSDREVKAYWIENLQHMFPDFDPSWIRYFLVHRARYVEPIHWINATHLIPEIITPVQHLYLATTAQIYPALTNGESVTRYATQVAQLIMERQGQGI
jgi:protoporphyrinogen oxidase